MRDSLYDFRKSIGMNQKNIGYKYEGKILKNSLSRYLYTFPKIADFLDSLEKPVFELFELVKVYKNRRNYAVAKDELNIK